MALMDKLVPGRSSDARVPDETELRQTVVLALGLGDVSAKVRTGDPVDSEADLAAHVWAGVRPMVASWGVPMPSHDVRGAIDLPAYLNPPAREPGGPGDGLLGGSSGTFPA